MTIKDLQEPAKERKGALQSYLSCFCGIVIYLAVGWLSGELMTDSVPAKVKFFGVLSVENALFAISAMGFFTSLSAIGWIRRSRYDQEAARLAIVSSFSEISVGGVSNGDRPLTFDDHVRCYNVYFATPIPLLSQNHTTRFFTNNETGRYAAKLQACLITLFLGWFTIPVGPLIMIVVLFKNFLGGDRYLIGQLTLDTLAEIKREEQRLEGTLHWTRYRWYCIASMPIAVVGVLLFGGVPAIVFGSLGLRECRRDLLLAGRRLSGLTLLVGIVTTVGSVWWWLS